MNEKKNYLGILILVILVAISMIILYFKNREDNSFEYNEIEDISLKHYEENEYIPVNITYDQIVRIYLQDYIYKLINKREDAYNLLDEEYRKIKFPTYNEFSEYIDQIMTTKFKTMEVLKFSIDDNVSVKYYDVYDTSGNLFIFKEEGVMQYTVFFDRYTVNI